MDIITKVNANMMCPTFAALPQYAIFAAIWENS